MAVFVFVVCLFVVVCFCCYLLFFVVCFCCLLFCLMGGFRFMFVFVTFWLMGDFCFLLFCLMGGFCLF